MSDQVLAALITGVCGIIAAAIGLIYRWQRARERRRMLAPGNAPPVFAAARNFAKSATIEQQKRAIQQIEVALSHGSLMLSSYQMEQCAGSDYELDRIGLYMFEEYTAQPNQAARVLHVLHEWDRLKSATVSRSVLPLTYAVRSLTSLARQQPVLPPRLRESAEVLHEIRCFVREEAALDLRDELAREVARLLAIIEQA